MRKSILFLVGASVLWGCTDYQINQKNPNVGGDTGFASVATIEVNPSPVEFGAQSMGSQTVTVVEVSNQGQKTLSLNGLYLHDESGVFTTTQIGDGSLEPGEFTNFVVTFSPTEMADYESRIDIYSNDPNRPTVELMLFGEVLGPRIAIEPMTHDFGQVGTPTDLALWVSNVGDAPLNVSDVTYISTSISELFLADSGDFSTGSGVLLPGEGTELIVHFAPTDSSTEEGTVHITSDDPTQSVAVASQFGSGLPCEGQPWIGDFFVQTYDGSEIRLYPSNGDGTFAAPVVIGDTLGELMGGALVVGDFDGDASMDILVKVRPSTNDSYRLVQFSYDACQEEWLPMDLLNPMDFGLSGAADLNQDGTLDVFGYSSAAGVGSVLLNDGVGNFSLVQNAYDVSAVYSGYRMASVYHAADLNGDSYPDLAMLEYSGSGSGGAGIYLIFGNGDGTFGTPARAHTLAAPANGMDFGDFDGDGFADLVVGLDDDGDPGQVWILLGDGMGLAPPIEVLDVDANKETGSDSLGFGGLILHDWNSDGVADVLTGFYSGAWVDPVLDLFLGDGAGGVSAESNVLLVGQVTSIRMAAPVSF
jgi:hypothetical protein